MFAGIDPTANDAVVGGFHSEHNKCSHNNEWLYWVFHIHSNNFLAEEPVILDLIIYLLFFSVFVCLFNGPCVEISI